MFEANIIYSFLFFITLFLAYYAYYANDRQDVIILQKSKHVRTSIFLAIIIYTVLLGLRCNVGIDYTSYYYIFASYKNNIPVDDVDRIFKILFPPMISLGIHYNYFVAFLAFVLIFTLFKGFENKLSILYIYIFYFFSNSIFFGSLNIMRQYAAIFIIFFAFKLFFDKSYIKFVILYILAFLIHRSCVIYLPFLLFVKTDLFKNRIIQFLLLLFSFIIGEKVFSILFDSTVLTILSPFMGESRYLAYIDSNNFLKMSSSSENVVASGLFKYFKLIIDIVIIYYSTYLKSNYSKYNISFFYNLYFIGIVMYNIFQFNSITLRLCTYFDIYRYYLLSILTYDCFHSFPKHKRYLKIFLYAVIILSVIFFYRSINNRAGGCAPWFFIWQAHPAIQYNF